MYSDKRAALLPLEGVKVVDFSQGVAGPYAGLLLALQGADVIKVEPPSGDWGRGLGTAYGDFSAFSVYYNRGKRSIALDLKSKDGHEAALRLAKEADIIIEAFRPGVMARYGLDCDTLSASNPKLIYLSVTGYGQEGSMINLPATDAVIQGYSGLMHLNRDKDGVPQRFPMIVIDVVTGIYAAQAIEAAFIGALRFGKGQYIDCNLLQCAAAFQAPRLMEHHFEGGNPPIMYVPVGVLETSDGHVSVSVMRDHHFVAFCEAMGRPDLTQIERFKKRVDRITNEVELMSIIREELRGRSTLEWSRRFTAAGVLHATVRTYQQVLADEEMMAHRYMEWLPHQHLAGSVPLANVPGALRASEMGQLSECPTIGQHTNEILAEIGMPVSPEKVS